MAWTYAEYKTRISTLLQDTGGRIFKKGTGEEIELAIEDTCSEIAQWKPYISDPDVFQVETRTGKATADSTSHLVDTVNAQFLETDVGKAVYNSDDKTWADVTGWTSSSDITLNKDIFPDGNESYSMFNKWCKFSNQINIEDIVDRYDIEDGDRIEHPIGTRRNIDSVDGDVLTIGVETSALDDTADSDADKDVHVYFRKRHFVSKLTTLTGAVNLGAGYDAGDTTMVLGTLQTSGTIEAGQLFTIAGTRGTYRVTTDATITATAATIIFYPGLESDVDDTTVVTFKQSTLSTRLEPIFCRFAAANLAIKKSLQPLHRVLVEAVEDLEEGRFSIDESNKGGPGTSTDWANYSSRELSIARMGRDYQAWGEREMAKVINELSGLVTSRAYEIFPRT